MLTTSQVSDLIGFVNCIYFRTNLNKSFPWRQIVSCDKEEAMRIIEVVRADCINFNTEDAIEVLTVSFDDSPVPDGIVLGV